MTKFKVITKDQQDMLQLLILCKHLKMRYNHISTLVGKLSTVIKKVLHYMHFYKKISHNLYFFFLLLQKDSKLLPALIIQRTLWQFHKFLYQQF